MPAVAEVYLVDANGDEIGWGGSPEPPPPPPPPPPPDDERFPGDPNPLQTGATYWGEAHGGNNDDPAPHETATGKVTAIRRTYFKYQTPSPGVYTYASITPPNGNLFLMVRGDHADGRLPCVSFKVHDWAAGANGGFDARFDALIAELQSYSKPTWIILNHEPENDGGNLTNYRAMQVRFRQRITAWENAHPTAPRRLAFGGSMMTYTWNPTSGRNPLNYYPGDGIWDFLGDDHYTEPNQEIHRANPWENFVTFCESHDLPFCLTEWGLRQDSEDPRNATKMLNFWNRMLDGTHDCVGFMYFDTDANSTGTGWTMSGNLLQQYNNILKDARVMRLADLGY